MSIEDDFNVNEDYKPSKELKAQDLFDGRLDAYGIREFMTANRRCLTDGDNFLWAYMNGRGSVIGFSAQYGSNGQPGKVFAAIGDAFDIHFFSKHEPQYWGFDTQEEWDAAKKRESDQARDELYAYVCAYVRGEPNNIKPYSIHGNKAKTVMETLEPFDRWRL